MQMPEIGMVQPRTEGKQPAVFFDRLLTGQEFFKIFFHLCNYFFSAYAVSSEADALATLTSFSAIIAGSTTSVVNQKYRNMKRRLFSPCGVAAPCNTYSIAAGLRLAGRKNASVSFVPISLGRDTKIDAGVVT